MRRAAFIVMLLLAVATARAIDQDVAFDDPKLQARYDHIIDQVRCLKCQNSTLRNSEATLAADLRAEIRQMIAEGKTDDEIYDFLVERYGEFALYKPRAQGKTLVLWLAPGLLLLGGAVILIGVLRRRMALPIDDDSGEGRP